MLRKPLTGVIDNATREQLTHIQEEALGNVISLDAAPTTTKGELKPNEIGHNGTTLYINIGGTIYSIALTAV